MAVFLQNPEASGVAIATFRLAIATPSVDPGERLAVRGSPPGALGAGVDWVPYAYVYPQPVEFPASNRLRFVVQPPDGEPIRREIPWKE